jgi:hemerythrin
MGNHEIDKQHKELFKLGHLLVRRLQDPETAAEHFHRVLNDIAETSREHFATEEEILARNGCPLLAEHCAAHRGYLEALAAILANTPLKDRDKTILLELVIDLVSSHLLEMDMPCKDFMKDERQ